MIDCLFECLCFCLCVCVCACVVLGSVCGPLVSSLGVQQNMSRTCLEEATSPFSFRFFFQKAAPRPRPTKKETAERDGSNIDGG